MKLTLTRGSVSWDLTGLIVQCRWSGDKRAISRQLSVSLAAETGSSLPQPQLGDRAALSDGDAALFAGTVLMRSMASESMQMEFTAYDDGYYLGRNDGTYQFSGTTPEAVTRLVCSDKEVPVAQLPSTGVQLRRKFSGIRLDQILFTVWSLAGEIGGKTYALRYTPQGLLVRERTEGSGALIVRGGSNLMQASTTESAAGMTNSVAIYDAQGNFLRRMGDGASQKLYGTMEQHLVQGEDGGAQADAQARRLLADGQMQQTVSIDLLGDTSLLSGETVVVQEPVTGLTGVFWIEADTHVWKNNACYSRLSLNCRNVMASAQAGTEN